MSEPTPDPAHEAPTVQPLHPFPGRRWGRGADSVLEEMRQDEARKPQAEPRPRAAAGPRKDAPGGAGS